MKIIDVQNRGMHYLCYHDDTFMVFETQSVREAGHPDDVVGACWPAAKKLSNPKEVPVSDITKGSG